LIDVHKPFDIISVHVYSDELIVLLENTERALGRGPPPVDPAASPRIVLTWPLPCATVDRPLPIAAVASVGARRVETVEFFVDETPLATVSAPPILPFLIRPDWVCEPLK